jgi:hypothetical protein
MIHDAITAPLSRPLQNIFPFAALPKFSKKAMVKEQNGNKIALR